MHEKLNIHILKRLCGVPLSIEQPIEQVALMEIEKLGRKGILEMGQNKRFCKKGRSRKVESSGWFDEIKYE